MKPHTARELFCLIDKELERRGLLPEILDYGLPDTEAVPIYGIAWDCIFKVRFGSNEGIYLDVYAEGYLPKDPLSEEDDEHRRIRLGCYKTLYASHDAFRTMAALGAEFALAAGDYIDEHMGEFDLCGYHVRFYKDDVLRTGFTGVGKSELKGFVEKFFSCRDYDYAIVTEQISGHEKRIENLLAS